MPIWPPCNSLKYSDNRVKDFHEENVIGVDMSNICMCKNVF